MTSSSSSSASSSWRFRVRHPDGSTKVVEDSGAPLGPHSTTDQLKALIARLFALPPDQFSIQFGRPLRTLDETCSSIQQAGLGDQEALTMVLLRGTNGSSGGESVPAALNGRQAALNTKGGKKRNKRKEEPDSDEDSELEVSLPSDDEVEENIGRDPTQTSRRGVKRSRTTTMVTARRPRKPKSTIKSTEELGEKLASAAANETRDSVSKFFRRLTKNEVSRQYEISGAQAKYTAALKNEFEITPIATTSFRLGDGSPIEFRLQIKYRKGPRSFDTEEVQGLGEELLKATIETLLDASESTDPDDALEHPREGLRPHMLPLVSPRFFWSLLHLKGGGPDCITKGLLSLLPDRDWSFLETRTRRQSAKAKEWEKTETLLDSPEQDNAIDSNEGQTIDELALAVPVLAGRKVLKRRGITTLLQLADMSPEDLGDDIDIQWVEAAQRRVLERFTKEILEQNEDYHTKLANLEVKTPSDISRLRIPGRTEMIQEELQVGREVVERWRLKADVLVARHRWLDSFRTRG